MYQQVIKMGILCLLGVLISCNSQSSRHLPILGSCYLERTTQQAPEDYLKLSNPLRFTIETLDAGKMLYQEKVEPVACIKCHGEDGDGFGPMANMFNPSPRNFTCIDGMNILDDGQLFWIIKNGSPETSMPAFDKLEDEQIWQLVAYIRDFSR